MEAGFVGRGSLTGLGVLAFLQDLVWLPWLGARSLQVVTERGKSGE